MITLRFEHILKFFGLVILSGLNSYLIYLIHSENYSLLLDASFDVLSGTPHWRAYQNRLLGPFILKILFPFGKYYEHTTGFLFYTLFTFFNNFIFYYFLRKIHPKKDLAFVYLVLFNLLFVVSQDFWLFAWDYIEISFAIFYGFIILSKKYYQLIPILTFIHIFNRETALIIILFFIMYFALEGRRDNLRLIILMIINFIFGISYTVLIRNYLFIQQNVYLDGGQDLENTFLGGNWIYPIENIKNLINGDFVENLIVITCLFLYFYYFKKNYKLFNFLEKNLVGLSLFMILPIFIFGNIVESRLYFSNIVIFIYLIYSRKLSKIN